MDKLQTNYERKVENCWRFLRRNDRDWSRGLTNTRKWKIDFWTGGSALIFVLRHPCLFNSFCKTARRLICPSSVFHFLLKSSACRITRKRGWGIGNRLAIILRVRFYYNSIVDVPIQYLSRNHWTKANQNLTLLISEQFQKNFLIWRTNESEDENYQATTYF